MSKCFKKYENLAWKSFVSDCSHSGPEYVKKSRPIVFVKLIYLFDFTSFFVLNFLKYSGFIFEREKKILENVAAATVPSQVCFSNLCWLLFFQKQTSNLLLVYISTMYIHMSQPDEQTYY